MLRNKVQDILNGIYFNDSAVYSVSGRAINDIMEAFDEIGDRIEQEYFSQFDNLQEEIQSFEIYVRELKSEIENLEAELDYERIQNFKLSELIYNLGGEIKE